MTNPERPDRKQPHSQGQGLVEFALVLPVFILLLFGVIDIGRLVYINNALSEGAREGARWGSVQGRSNTPSDVQAHTIGIMSAVPDATVTVTCQSPIGTTVSICGSNDILTVAVSSQVTMLTPVISNLIGTNTYTATAKVTVNQ